MIKIFDFLMTPMHPRGQIVSVSKLLSYQGIIEVVRSPTTSKVCIEFVFYVRHWRKQSVIFTNVLFRQFQEYNGTLCYQCVDDKRAKYRHKDRTEGQTVVTLLSSHFLKRMLCKKSQFFLKALLVVYTIPTSIQITTGSCVPVSDSILYRDLC